MSFSIEVSRYPCVPSNDENAMVGIRKHTQKSGRCDDGKKSTRPIFFWVTIIWSSSLRPCALASLGSMTLDSAR